MLPLYERQSLSAIAQKYCIDYWDNGGEDTYLRRPDGSFIFTHFSVNFMSPVEIINYFFATLDIKQLLLSDQFTSIGIGESFVRGIQFNNFFVCIILEV